MKTSVILHALQKNKILELSKIYEIANANTKEERHSVRGLIASLQKRGLVVHKGIGLWAIK